ncbi:DUF4013 domain-containing protein [Halomicrobium katesii]|uniref:DUF4013 domain-containing protein n=1 Tax=Halomicrobium katesii TaxID=437163 RepID=UPI000371E995|nr:DUF4013 domain-containing protein [Halomicrobium katesii]
MLEDAIKYQLQGDKWLKRVGIGGLVVILGFFVVPLFTFQGYMLEVMRRALGGDTATPPEWDELDLIEATVDGLRYLLVVLPYTIGALLVAMIPAAIVAVLGVVSGNEGLFFLAVLIAVLCYFVGLIAVAVAVPVATANFVRKDSVSAAFDLDVVRTLVTNRTMLVAVLLAFAVNIIASVVGSVLGFTIVGLLAIPWVQFVFQSAIFYVWGSGFADAYEEEYGEPPLARGTDVSSGDPSAPADGTF